MALPQPCPRSLGSLAAARALSCGPSSAHSRCSDPLVGEQGEEAALLQQHRDRPVRVQSLAGGRDRPTHRWPRLFKRLRSSSERLGASSPTIFILSESVSRLLTPLPQGPGVAVPSTWGHRSQGWSAGSTPVQWSLGGRLAGTARPWLAPDKPGGGLWAWSGSGRPSPGSAGRDVAFSSRRALSAAGRPGLTTAEMRVL